MMNLLKILIKLKKENTALYQIKYYYKYFLYSILGNNSELKEIYYISDSDDDDNYDENNFNDDNCS
jgi:hypothetical protein